MVRFASLVFIGLLVASLSPVSRGEAMTVTQLELTGGAVNGGGRYDRMLDRLVGQDGALVMGQYQPMGEIVPSITKGRRTFSLFTSGLTGAPAPTAIITGAMITVDLSSLFVGITRGDAHQILNIGGLATGLFDSETREFCLSWDHLFDGRKQERLATFFLRGVIDVAPQPVAIPASLALYATGLFGLGSWIWRRRRAIAA